MKTVPSLEEALEIAGGDDQEKRSLAAPVLADEVRRLRGTPYRVLSFISHRRAFIVGPTKHVVVTGISEAPRESPLVLPDGAEVIDVPAGVRGVRADDFARERGGVALLIFEGAKPEARFSMSVGEAFEAADGPILLNMGGVEDHKRLRAALNVLAAELRKRG